MSWCAARYRVGKKNCFSSPSPKERNCRYCEAAHLACCRMLGVDVDRIASNLLNTMTDPVLRDMVLFGTKCAREPQAVTREDYDVLRKHSLSQSKIMEIV